MATGRRIDPDDLEDAEWDAIMAAASRPAAREAPGDHILDAWDGIWTVDDTRLTRHSFALYLGRPVPISGPQGAAVIITHELRDYLDAHRRSPELIDLPLGRSAIKRLRRVLGHNWYEDGEKWWLDRWEDLISLTTADFAAKYHVKPAAVTYARLSIIGTKQRAAMWWADPEVANLVLSPQPRIYVAQMLGISVSHVGKLKTELRRKRGDDISHAAAVERMRSAKTGVPAHPNTKAALLSAAKAPKSAEWREGLSNRNRQRPRPTSWIAREWGAEEDAILGTAPDRSIAERLGRTIDAVRSRRQALRIKAFAR